MDPRLFQYMQVYDVPTVCKDCGGVLVYRGLGEYCCEQCGAKDYDNYGKARNYIEENPGSSVADVEKNTGVHRSAIRWMLKEQRFEISANSRTFLHCEQCGKEIRSGRYCPACEDKVHRAIERQQREELRKDTQGFAMGRREEEGQRRFKRSL